VKTGAMMNVCTLILSFTRSCALMAHVCVYMRQLFVCVFYIKNVIISDVDSKKPPR